MIFNYEKTIIFFTFIILYTNIYCIIQRLCNIKFLSIMYSKTILSLDFHHLSVSSIFDRGSCEKYEVIILFIKFGATTT